MNLLYMQLPMTKRFPYQRFINKYKLQYTLFSRIRLIFNPWYFFLYY